MQAELLNVRLGAVVAAMDNAAYPGIPPSGGSCAPAFPTEICGAPGLSITLPAFDPTKEVEAEVYAQISLTFAIAA